MLRNSKPRVTTTNVSVLIQYNSINICVDFVHKTSYSSNSIYTGGHNDDCELNNSHSHGNVFTGSIWLLCRSGCKFIFQYQIVCYFNSLHQKTKGSIEFKRHTKFNTIAIFSDTECHSSCIQIKDQAIFITNKRRLTFSKL